MDKKGTRSKFSRALADTGARRPPSVFRLAKLTRPQLPDAVPRDRLFAQLDHLLAERPILWIHGPPGAGKTTLIASYLNVTNRSGIWYQLDHDDGDPASFFYYLGLASAGRTFHGRQPMPLLTPEYLPDIEGFARRFFRELISRIGESSFVVFDNYQEVAASSVLHKAVACSLSEIPAAARVVVLSRAEPPPEYARHIANTLIAQLGWEELRLTLDETRLLASARQTVSPEVLQTLHEQSNGWAAGLILMLERLRQSGAIDPVAQPESLETVFNYFAGEVFEQLSTDTRNFLIRTSVLPRITANLATALTGSPDAAKVLADLHKQQLFIDRREGDTLSYQYHALFRLFLQAKAKELSTTADWNALVIASAEALTAGGQPEEAVPLFIAGQSWEAAIRSIVTQAQGLLTLGRWQTVQQWIDSLPEAIRNATPWLRFWLGMCRLHADPASARLDLEPAYALFQRADDPLGQVLAATAINEAHMLEWVDYRRLDSWIASVEALLRRGDLTLPSLNTELAVRASLFTAVLLRQTYREDIPHLARNLADMLCHDLDPNYQLLAARGLFIYGAYSGDFMLIDEVAGNTESAFCAPGASALNRVWYAARLGFALRYFKNSRDQARAWFLTAREIGREHGLRFVEAPIAIFSGWAEEVFGETADLQREFAIADACRNPGSRFESAFHQMGIAFLLARQNDLRGAVAHMSETLSFHERCGYTLGRLAAYFGLTAARLRIGDFAGAGDALEDILKVFFPSRSRSYAEDFFGAGIALGLGNEDRAKDQLRRAMALGAKYGLEHLFAEHLVRPVTAVLCAHALKHGIEPDYVKRIIHAQRLAPPSAEIENWPWPVRIRALGGFALELADRPITFSGKTPKKPLELLKALATSGKTQVDIAWLGEHLWPHAQEHAVRDAVNVTLSRMRKLLPMDGLVLHSDGKLSLNCTLVWCDVWAFDRIAEDCLQKLKHGAQDSAIESAGDRLLSLYSGDLLKGEPDAPWLLSARDRLRSRFLRTLISLGHFWEAQESWAMAQNLYERVLEVDNVAEDIYRRLMDCHARAGRPAEALRVYLRCRQMLSSVLGIAPSRDTEALCSSIRLR